MKSSMKGTRKNAASRVANESDSEILSRLLAQYGCGPVQFTGADSLYERHLIFDNVADLPAAGSRQRFEALARSVRDVLSQRWVLTEKKPTSG